MPGVARRLSLRQGWQPSCEIGGSFAVESAAALPWNRWQAWHGISGSFPVERVAALPWNQWQDSPGIGGSFRVEYAAVEAWGKAAAQMSGLHAGQAALVEGKIARAKRAAKDPQAGDDWYTTVQAWRVQAVEAEEDTHA